MGAPRGQQAPVAFCERPAIAGCPSCGDSVQEHIGEPNRTIAITGVATKCLPTKLSVWLIASSRAVPSDGTEKH